MRCYFLKNKIMKIYLGLFLSLITTSTFTQPQFTAGNCFQPGASSRLGFAIVAQNFDNFIGQTGANYTWDFSSTGTPGPWTSWTNPTASYYFRPAAQSIHSLFQTSQINEYAEVAFARDHFYSYSPSRDTLYIDGFYASSNLKYAPPVPYLTFPMIFSDSVYTHTVLKYGAIRTGSVTRYWIYDGFGTVKFPYGESGNVYRIRTKQIDSSYVLNTVMGTAEELIWIRQSDGIPVLRLVKSGTITGAYFASVSGSNGISENFNDGQISIYPNPFTDQLTISNRSNEEIRQLNLYNIQGLLLVQENGPFNNLIHTRNLADGIYVVEMVLTDHSIVRKKLVK